MGVGVALSEEVCHCELVFRSHAQAMPSVAHSFSFLPADEELSAPSPAPCLPVCCHASHYDDNGLNL